MARQLKYISHAGMVRTMHDLFGDYNTAVTTPGSDGRVTIMRPVSSGFHTEQWTTYQTLVTGTLNMLLNMQAELQRYINNIKERYPNGYDAATSA